MKRTEMRRTAFRPRRPVRRVSLSVYHAVAMREGYRCFRCGQDRDRFQVHHRHPTRMGGSRDPRLNELPNLIWLCAPCHGWVESHRIAAMTAGLLLPAGAIPADEPLLLRGGLRVFLTADGRYEVAA